MALPKIADLVKEADPQYLSELSRTLQRKGYLPMKSPYMYLITQEGHFFVGKDARIIIDYYGETHRDSQPYLKLYENEGSWVIYENDSAEILEQARDYLIKCIMHGVLADFTKWEPKQ